MSQTEQNYKNHARWLPPFHFFVLPVLLANVIYSIQLMVGDPSLGTGFALLVAAALFMLALLARTQALKAQDRVIRLEMRLRLREVLPPDLHPRILELTPEHMIGLRFAGDAELPELVRQALGGTLATTKSCKEAVKDWQADHLRV
jgi:hypothetical protein